MEKDKRRSKEEEEELDRKIALIREKNLKIEQRSKEVEEDRVNNTEVIPKKPSQPATNQPSRNGGKNKVWDREWDQGKTPADQWRENVPSIEHSRRLAGHMNLIQEKPAGNKNRSRRDGQQHNSSKQNNQTDQKITKANGTPHQKQRNRRLGNPENRNIEQEAHQKDTLKDHKEIKKSRPRKENDRYVIRKLVTNLVDKVDKMERKRRREEQKKDEQSQIEPLSEQQLRAKTQPKARKHPIEPVKDNSPGKENVEASPDANQNVIQLTRERVLTVQSS